MPSFVHVARIMPGQREAFKKYVKDGFEAGRDGLKSLGFTRITSFVTPEATDSDGGLLVTIYEAKDASVVKGFYALQPVIQQEERAHGTFVTPHDHDAVPFNTPFIELDLT